MNLAYGVAVGHGHDVLAGGLVFCRDSDQQVVAGFQVQPVQIQVPIAALARV